MGHEAEAAPKKRKEKKDWNMMCTQGMNEPSHQGDYVWVYEGWDPIHLFINDLILCTEVNTPVQIYPVQFSTLTTTDPFPVRD